MSLRATIVELIKQQMPVQTRWAEVKSVNWQDKTMTVVIDDLEYHNVLLGLGDHQVRPEDGSKVLVGMIENKEPALWLIHAEKIREQWINGDGHGGLVIAPELKKQIDKNTAAIKKLQDAVTAWVPSPQDGGAALKTQLSTPTVSNPTPFSGMQLANLSKIENKEVKHG